MKKTRTMPPALLALTFVLVSMGGDSPRPGKGSLPEYNGPTLTADEKQLIADTLLGLRSLSEQSKTAGNAFRFLQNYSTIGKFLSRGRVAANMPKTVPYFFLVADLQMSDKKIGGEFFCEPPTMLKLYRLSAGSKLAMSLTVVHELSHARDCLIGHEPPSPMFSPIWMMGELNAYGTVKIVLDEYTGGGWSELVESSALLRQNSAISQGKKPDSSVLGLVEGDERKLETMFPAIGKWGMDFLDAQLIVDANILNLEREGKRLNRDSAEVARMMSVFMGHFYKYMFGND
jgi:hypothetical protein